MHVSHDFIATKQQKLALVMSF